MSDILYKNKKNVKKLEKKSKCELSRCEVEAMSETAKNVEDEARGHNCNIFYWHVNKLRRE